MNEIDLIRLLPTVYNLIDKPKTRYDILRTLEKETITKVGTRDRDYRKVDELIEMGFLKKKNTKPPTFVADKEAIWEFWKKTPIGKIIVEMFSDRTVLPIE